MPMAGPRIPDRPDHTMTLPCGRDLAIDELDLGMRELACRCGARHAVVMDVHPLSRWIPESVVEVLVATIGTDDEYDEFGTMHVMAIVREEFPDRVAVHDASANPAVGFALCWVCDVPAKRLHEIIVELLVDLMDHAVSHAADPSMKEQFAGQLDAFDLETFVTRYRDERDFEPR